MYSDDDIMGNIVQDYASVIAIIFFVLYAVAEFVRPAWRKFPFWIFASAACTLLYISLGFFAPYFTKSEVTASPEELYTASRSIMLIILILGAHAVLKHIRPRG